VVAGDKVEKFTRANLLTGDELGVLWYEALAMQSPSVLGGEMRGGGNGPCHGAPPEPLQFTNFERIASTKCKSEEHGSLMGTSEGLRRLITRFMKSSQASRC